MKRISAITVCCMLLLLKSPVLASPQSDAEVIVDAMLTEELHEYARDTVMLAYARALSDALQERSVRVRDLERFADLLSTHLSEPTLADLRQDMMERSLHSLRTEPERLATIAGYLRSAGPQSYELKIVILEDGTLSVAEKWADSVAFILGDESPVSENYWALTLAWLFTNTVHAETKVEADLMAPYMVEILEDDGVFQFPNRTWRNALIREIQAAIN